MGLKVGMLGKKTLGWRYTRKECRPLTSSKRQNQACWLGEEGSQLIERDCHFVDILGDHDSMVQGKSGLETKIVKGKQAPHKYQVMDRKTLNWVQKKTGAKKKALLAGRF